MLTSNNLRERERGKKKKTFYLKQNYFGYKITKIILFNYHKSDFVIFGLELSVKFRQCQILGEKFRQWTFFPLGQKVTPLTKSDPL